MQIVSFICAAVLGFILFEVLSNPERKKHKLPNIKIKFIEILPNTKIHFKGKIIHVHHWMYLSLVLVVTIFYNPIIIDTVFAKGAMFGGVAQGLTFPDWKSIIKKRSQ